MLFNEPKLLKSPSSTYSLITGLRFSALQRAEIAEIPACIAHDIAHATRFSALQRAEIAEMSAAHTDRRSDSRVSVLFNEPKLLKCTKSGIRSKRAAVSVLFNEPKLLKFFVVRGQIESRCAVSVLFNEPKLLK